MALAVLGVRGVTSSSRPATTGSWTSTSGSLIIVVGFEFNATGSPLDGDVTDSKSNTYTFAPGAGTYGGASHVGLGVWYNNGGTRGASHTVSYSPAGTGDALAGVIEITGQDTTSAVYDTTTKALGTDGVSSYDVTAAAAISGNQIAIYGAILEDAFVNNAWTQPGGYSSIYNEPNGASFTPSIASYKLNETGTPTVGATRAEATTIAKEVFATFKEAVSTVQKVRSQYLDFDYSR